MTTIHFCKLAIFGIFTSIYLTMVLNETGREVVDPMVLKGWRLEGFGYRQCGKGEIGLIFIDFSLPDPFTQEEGQKALVLLTERAIKSYNKKAKLEPMFNSFPVNSSHFEISLKLFQFPTYPVDTLRHCAMEKGNIRYFYATPPFVRPRVVEESYEEARLAVLGDREYTLEELDDMIPEAGLYPDAWGEQMKEEQKKAGRRQQKRQRRAQRARGAP